MTPFAKVTHLLYKEIYLKRSSSKRKGERDINLSRLSPEEMSTIWPGRKQTERRQKILPAQRLAVNKIKNKSKKRIAVKERRFFLSPRLCPHMHNFLRVENDATVYIEFYLINYCWFFEVSSQESQNTNHCGHKILYHKLKEDCHSKYHSPHSRKCIMVKKRKADEKIRG